MKIDWVPFPTLKRLLPPFFLDYVQDFDRAGSFFRLDYRRVEPIAQMAREIQRPVGQDVAARIEAYSQSIGAPPEAMASVARLRSGCCCVMTGQQPGLFGGPLYNLYKAITAIQLALRIEASSGVPAVPVFWNHSDDHSLEEFAWVDVPTRTGPQGFGLKIKGDTPAYLFDASWWFPVLLSRLQNLSPLADGTGDLLKEIYRENLAISFSRLMTRLFGKMGLVVVEPRVAEGLATQKFYGRALAQHRDVRACLERGEEALEQAGYSPPLKGTLGSGLFLILQGRRSKVEYVDGKMYAGGQELQPFVPGDTHRYSPQVFLRPILQDSIFPTCAYVGGPNEIAYFAELRELYQLFGVMMPAVFPRLSATIIEPSIERVLAKMQIRAEDLFEDSSRIQEAAFRALQGTVLPELDSMEGKVRKAFDEISALLLEVDRGLEPSIQKTGANISTILEGFKRRVLETLKSKEQVVVSRLQRVLDAVRPNGELQERRYTMTMALGMPELLDQIVEVTDPFVFGHKILYP